MGGVNLAGAEGGWEGLNPMVCRLTGLQAAMCDEKKCEIAM